MRLFYIIFSLLIFFNLSGFAFQKKEAITQKSKIKETFVSSKTTSKITLNLPQEQENLGKDLIKNSTLKGVSVYFILFTFIAFFLSVNKIINTKVSIKKLRFNYWCLFKMLYPKHVFW
ncbi:hypothetical protein ACFOUY_11970 [Pedobacter jamesrossensis]|uniref:Uncharacterized protein n=1 Tax=Pedobacter jamesrossensis TaxID=1908238 RepID=A0ABV8NPA1_9SPHI